MKLVTKGPGISFKEGGLDEALYGDMMGHFEAGLDRAF